MENLEKEMSSETPELTPDKDPKTVVKAAVFLIQKGIKDQVYSVSLLLRSVDYFLYYAKLLWQLFGIKIFSSICYTYMYLTGDLNFFQLNFLQGWKRDFLLKRVMFSNFLCFA